MIELVDGMPCRATASACELDLLVTICGPSLSKAIPSATLFVTVAPDADAPLLALLIANDDIGESVVRCSAILPEPYTMWYPDGTPLTLAKALPVSEAKVASV